MRLQADCYIGVAYTVGQRQSFVGKVIVTPVFSYYSLAHELFKVIGEVITLYPGRPHLGVVQCRRMHEFIDDFSLDVVHKTYLTPFGGVKTD